MKIAAIIQARMGSKRLPGKVLLPINFTPLIKILLDRLQISKVLNEIIVATSIDPKDNKIENFIKNNYEIKVFRGSENDVLSRYYHCAKKHNVDVVVRITADDPLKDSEIVDKAVKLFLSNKSIDYCSNTIIPTYPEGLDVEVFSFQALKSAYENAKLNSEREHVTPYITNNPSKFKILNFKFECDLSNWRWTVDKKIDLEFMNIVFNHFKDDYLINYKDIIKILNENPKYIKINQGTERMEGYLKSVEEDKLKYE